MGQLPPRLSSLRGVSPPYASSRQLSFEIARLMGYSKDGGDAFVDSTSVSAMVDRIVHHHADVFRLKDNSYRLRKHH